MPIAEAVTSGKRATSDSIKRLAEKSPEPGSRARGSAGGGRRDDSLKDEREQTPEILPFNGEHCGRIRDPCFQCGFVCGGVFFVCF